MSAAVAATHAVESTSIATELDAAIVTVLERFGSDRLLAPINWTVVDYPEGPVVEGRPVSECKDAESICAQWAASLEMVEYDWDSVDGERSWRLDVGSWHLELIACHERSLDLTELLDD